MSQAKNPESHSGRRPNRLINEQSPYLRQHAYNPVDWYAWGLDALERARTESREEENRGEDEDESGAHPESRIVFGVDGTLRCGRADWCGSGGHSSEL